MVALVSGLRRAELVSLTVHSLADDWSLLCVVQTKGGHQRKRRLPPSLVQLIASGTESDPRSAFAPGQRLFGIAASTLYTHLRRYGEAAGLGSVLPHVLRHTAAKFRRQAGATIEEVSSLLGHTSIATTAIYLRRLEDEPDSGGERVAQALGIAGLLSGWRTGATAGSGRRAQPGSDGRAAGRTAAVLVGEEDKLMLPCAYKALPASPDPDQGPAKTRRLEGRKDEDGPPVSPACSDERIGILKSAVQKHIRRGEADSVRAATRLLALPRGQSALRRRLPVIAAEDVGWWWIPAASVSEDGLVVDAQVLGIIASLSSLHKDKSAYWLAATVWDGRLQVSTVSAAAFRGALADGDHRRALALAIAARERRQWRSGDRLIRALAEAFADSPEAARLIGESALRREAKGGSGKDELLAAAVIAAIDRPSGPLPELPQVTPVAESHWQLPWYCAEIRTSSQAEGPSGGLRYGGIPFQMLAELQFSYQKRARWPSRGS